MRRMLPALAAVFVRVLYATLRVRHVNVENITSVPQYILSFWHAHLLLMLHSRYRKPIRVMSSQSRDGAISAGVFRYYGVHVSRGSSSRGGSAAIREMIRGARAGQNIVFTPDGPTGPARIVKDGIVFAAQATGLPIVPIAFAAKKKSYWRPGTGWSSRCRSHASSSSTARRSPYRVMATSRSGAGRWSGR